MRRSTFLAGALLTTMALLVPAAPAAAKPGARRLRPIEGRLRVGRGEEQSTNWSGYAAYGTTFTQASGSWVQPAANCSSVRGRQIALAAFWVGLDGYLNKTVEQTGTEADCEGSRAIYYAWYELYPERLFVIAHEVEPGDVLNAKVTQGTLELEDETAGWHSKEEFLPGSLEFSSAEWIAEKPYQRFTDFGSVRFSGASASDATTSGSISAWENDKVVLVSGRGRRSTVLAEPDALEKGGSAFTIEQP